MSTREDEIAEKIADDIAKAMLKQSAMIVAQRQTIQLQEELIAELKLRISYLEEMCGGVVVP